MENDNLPSNRCLLEWTITEEVARPRSDALVAARELFDRAITTFRLLKDGRVESEHVYRRNLRPGQIWPLGGYSGSIYRRYPITDSYSLLQNDVGQLQQLWSIVASENLPRRLRTAIDRLNLSAERLRPDDQIVDALVSLDALFGDGGGAGGYKIGLRCARFLGTDLPHRVRIRDMIEDGWQRRSALVHGGHSSASSRSAEELVRELHSLIRLGVQAIAEQFMSSSDLPGPRDVDNLLLA